MPDPQPDAIAPEPFVAPAADGFPVRGFAWRHRSPAAGRPVTVINCATSVRCRYYFRFAAYLFRHGSDVLVYDYRGIGESRPASLAGFHASWLDWGRLDCDAVLQYASRTFAGQPVDVVAHSVGGVALGLAASNPVVRRALTVGSQYAYWRDYAGPHRLRMLIKWHFAMPILARVFGYVPAKRLGWMEDTPRGVALSWSRSRPRFEDAYLRAPLDETPDARRDLVERFTRLTAPMLAIGLSDDEFGSVEAVERLLGYYTRSAVTHLRIAPEQIGAASIGHFAFFHSRFEPTLWPIALGWLKTGALAPQTPGDVYRQSCAPERGLAARDEAGGRTVAG
ncbi:serine aminopeptidase domain-containing protein [Burkholderia thailandensis]|uniref:alpha/beta hydrolase family protein n=1 Tax=Burkholderia thailandensis TaxID=57975 RepID=UPI0003EC86B5|nr:alpha/beta hydrolase [Burkholderia thailandensis]AHI65836.1 alpha/beta hydrolase family protein [Burkholderia thailandensis H0587]AJY29246.1 alpha/beta hydrolase family protein [Burkholderia thailandensis 34]AOJ50462.1 alpha/beta hydrolase [Burkholderia thailandensis]AOJ57311.1 alpha/beta hydrolase [Burkholderia thailandensis]AVR25872.1 alpha/beta hydrolase [Burkholderia thailandensis]